MPEYNDYTDENGVRWLIIWTERYIFATHDDTQERQYIPEPNDIGPVGRAMDEGADQAEADRARFLRLREDIDKFARENKARVGLRVTATPPSRGVPWWVYVGAALLLARKRR